MPSDLMRSDRSKCTRPNGFSLLECLVIGLPLGISRSGVYRGDPGDSLSSALCLPSDA